jgi:hypothetical protein
MRLNETAAGILSLCDGSRSIDQITAILAAGYRTSAEAIGPDLIEFLDRLSALQLIRFTLGSSRDG